MLLHPPDQMIDAVLAEEGFIVEDEQRHAPVAGFALIGLVGGDLGVEPSCVLVHGALDIGSVEARLGQCAREVIALVPIVHLA